MHRFPVVPRVLAVLFAASLACSLPGAPAGPEPLPSDETPTAVSTPESESTPGGAVEILEPPPPAGLTEALQAKVESGEWSYEEGLVQSLKMFTGETQLSGLFPERPANVEGFGLVREAQRYLRVGSDAATKAEIERLLSIIAPPPERLLDYASPAPTGSVRPNGPAARPRAAEDCEALYKEGFPPGSGIKCLLLKEGGVSGQTVRVFWPMIGVNTDYADAAYNGVIIAWQKYSQLTPPAGISILKGVDVVFALLNAQESPTILALVPSAANDNRCLIVVYLPAIQENEQSKGGPGDFGHFMQTIAHEMFHCYQVWNFPEQADDTWSVQDWWGEGTATYFSNVVWPEVNTEWEWLDDFAYHSLDTSVVYMSYDNFAFFQFLGKSIGDNGVLKLIASMPFGGDESGQASALAAFPGLQDLFHEFGRAYMDGTIVDSGGKKLPTTPPFIPAGRTIVITETQIRTLDATPFVISRYAITFPIGHLYTIAQVLTGSAEGYLSARVDTATGAWGDLPEKVAAGCAPVTFYVVLTNAAAAGTFSTEVTMTPTDELACDQCLIGIWDLNVPSFEEYASAPFKEIPGFYFFDGAAGLFRYRYRKDGTMKGEFQFTYLYHLNQENSPLGNDIRVDGKIRLLGDGDGTYTTDGVGHLGLYLGQDNVTITQQIWMNGVEEDKSPLGGSPQGLTGSSALYSCDDQKLFLNFLPESTLPPLQFDRVPGEP
jgi:hypothetical protein